MLSRRRHLRGRGASSLLLLGASWLVLAGGLGAGEVVAVTAADARSEQAAAAAAHAAAAELAADPGAGALSVELQAARTACHLPEETAAPAACAPARVAAQRVARANGAGVVDFLLGPDPRDRGPEPAPGRIVAVVTVEVERGLPLLRRLCARHRPGAALCVARATAAARWG
ncbi:MAG: hypothetical protein E6I76_04315 [Chloroflexi bacterium]|nr:MAG: hypothetical protein E6J03_02395 [Chloroflexota bacterium]TMD98480.1 MAG: hypothetical protein E6I76_04315 [Chloroflexota bacterium]